MQLSTFALGAPERLNSTSSDVTAAPRIASLADGTFMICWVSDLRDDSEMPYRLNASVFDAAGNPVQQDFLIDPTGIRNQLNPAITSLDNQFLMVWEHSLGTTNSTQATLISASGTVSSSITELADSSFFEGATALTTLDSGEVLASLKRWDESTGASDPIDAGLASLTLSNGAVQLATPSFSVNADAEHSQSSPNVAQLKNGNIVALWSEDYVSDELGWTSNIEMRLFDAELNALNAEQRITDSSADARYHTDVDLLALDNGDFVLMWRANDGSNSDYDIHLQLYSADGSVLRDIDSSAINSTADEYAPRWLALSDGNYLLYWRSAPPTAETPWAIKAQFFNENFVPFDGITTLVTPTPLEQFSYPDAAALPDGGFVLTWGDQASDDQKDAYVQLFSPAVTTADAGTSADDDLVVISSESLVGAATGYHGLAGNDRFEISIGDQTNLSATVQIDGGDGLDALRIDLDSSALQELYDHGTGASLHYQGDFGDLRINAVATERLQLNDTMLALDLDGTAGQAYRLYKAAFDRNPDATGLGFWIDAMDNGSNIQDVAGSFINSDEFKQLYGENLSDSEFLTALYANVMGRTPDVQGFQWWLAALASGESSRASVLVGFSESAENQQNVVELISQGIAYDLWQ